MSIRSWWYSITIKATRLLVSDILQYFVNVSSFPAALTDNKNTADEALLRTLTRSTGAEVNKGVCVSMLGLKLLKRRHISAFHRFLITNRRSMRPTAALRPRRDTADQAPAESSQSSRRQYVRQRQYQFRLQCNEFVAGQLHAVTTLSPPAQRSRPDEIVNSPCLALVQHCQSCVHRS